MNSELMPHDANNIESKSAPKRFENLVMVKEFATKVR
jgi:hypothetical protein